MHLKSNKVNVIKILPGGVVTAKDTAEIQLDENGEFVRNPEEDIVKVAVVERHQGTGNVACGFLKGYGIKAGAVALSIAHDSHNIIVVGVSDEEMEFAVNSLIAQEGWNGSCKRRKSTGKHANADRRSDERSERRMGR